MWPNKFHPRGGNLDGYGKEVKMNGLMRWDPFRDLTDIHRRLDKIFDDFWGGWPTVGKLPAMDVYTEDDKQLVAEVHAPGFTKDDIEISVNEGVLEIKGRKEEKEEQEKKRSYMMRQSSSSFYRRIALPQQANADKIEANFENGLLKVVVPFKELPKPKKISIKSGK
jgi:HSP20 family protein